MTKKDGSRFDNFINAARAPKPTPTPETPTPTEAAPTEKSPPKKSKSSDPNYMRTTVYLPRQIHRRLKSAAADEEKEISEIIEELVTGWLASREKS